jgi:hypothetical protein
MWKPRCDVPSAIISRTLNSFSFIAVVVFTSALLTSVVFSANAGHERFVKGEILVKPRTGLGKGRFSKIIEPRGGESIDIIAGIDVHVISVPEHAEEKVIAALSEHPNIEFAELNRYHALTDYTPNDPKFSSAWHLQTMNLPAAWEVTRGNGITVAVLDTGVNPAHVDLSGKLVAGRNVVSNNSDTSDIHGHGTKVAGVVGAVMDNGEGVASIAPGAMIMPIRITNSSDGWATTSAMASGITWAADNGARVANISYEATSSSTVRNAADYMRSRGGMVVSSAGNDGSLRSTADSDSIITVSATGSSDVITGWSNYGAFVDVAAPGAGLWTTSSSGGYASVSGTSFSAPAAAATIAMIMSVDGSLTPGEIEVILEDSAEDLGTPGRDDQYGHGRVDTLAAVQLAGGQPTPQVDLYAPTVAITSPANSSQVSGVVGVDASAADNVAVTHVRLYAGNNPVGTDYSSPYRFSWNADTASEGETVVLRAVATDSSGNTGESTIRVLVADTTPPVISRPSNRTVEASGQLTAVALGTATANDNVDGTVPVTTGNTGPFAVGTHQVVWTASDSSGNTATAVQTVTVRDTTAPLVSAPAGLTVEASGDLTSVSLGQGTAIDSVDGALVATATPSGPFTAGSHVVTWRATDSAGNTGSATQLVTITQADNSPPRITLPADVTVEATGRTTAVNIGQAVAVDDRDGPVTTTPSTDGPFPVGVTLVTWSASDAEGNSATATQRVTVYDSTPPQLEVPADLAVGATGVLTALDLGEAVAYDTVSGNITPVADNDGPFASGRYEVTWTATDAAGNSTSAVQYVTILPQADFAIDQTVSEGSEVTVSVALSGPAPDYPVVIPYRVSGSAGNPYDHDAADGTIVINNGVTGALAFLTVDDGVNGEAPNTVVFEMQAPDNAVAGSSDRHVVTIIEENAAPLVELDVTQDGAPTRTVYPYEGPVVVSARVRDPNPGDDHVYDWSLSDNRLVSGNGTGESDFIVDPQYLSPGQYILSVTVTDNGMPGESVTVDIVLNAAQTPPLLGSSDDRDQDGVADAAEGAGDSDQDGVPDYLDSIDNPAVLQGLDGVSSHHLLVADAGVNLRLGATAMSAGAASALVDVQDLADGGSGEQGSLEFPGGVFDFVITGLAEHGQSVRVVLPQLVPLANRAVYRKHIPGSGWQDFVTDSGNRVASARGSDGACPAPGDAAWREGLRSGDWCIRLTIEDGGPNDADGLRNGVIRDPGGAGSVPAATTDGASGSGGGGGGGCALGDPRSAVDPVWLLMLMVTAAGYLRRRRQLFPTG